MPPPFPLEARKVVVGIRRAFTQVLASVGADPLDPQSIGKACGLNKNLAWKLSKIITADDPAEALQQMPGPAGIKIFLDRGAGAGADEASLAKAREAVEQYDRLIEVHSGDRATLEMMGGELSERGRRAADEQHRKLLFQGGSYVWGVQARVVAKIGIVGPSAAEGMLDFASISALIDFRRLRENVSWVMASRSSSNDDGSEMKPFAQEAMDPLRASADVPPLMDEFCSQPPPVLRRSANPNGGGSLFELVDGPIGNTGAITSVVGTLQRRIPYLRSPENEWGEHFAICDTPAELMIVDLYFHESLTFALNPTLELHSLLRPSTASSRDRTRLPSTERLIDLGAGGLLPPTPEVRNYAEMISAAHARTGWDLTRFHGFRVKIAYPACPSAVMLRYPLPEALV